MERPSILAIFHSERAEYVARCEDLADQRVNQLREDWNAKFPGKPLHIRFGHGSELIEYTSKAGRVRTLVQAEWISDDGFNYSRSAPHSVIELLSDAMSEIEEITDQYRDCCPDDLTPS